MKYSANGEAVENTAAYIEMTSAGAGYVAIPPASGLIKKEADESKTQDHLQRMTLKDLKDRELRRLKFSVVVLVMSNPTGVDW